MPDVTALLFEILFFDKIKNVSVRKSAKRFSVMCFVDSQMIKGLHAMMAADRIALDVDLNSLSEKKYASIIMSIVDANGIAIKAILETPKILRVIDVRIESRG